MSKIEENCVLRLKKKGSRCPRVLEGHPWVFAGEVETPLPESPSSGTCALLDSSSRFLGRGLYNPRSNIVWRRYTKGSEPFDRPFLAKALQMAMQRRPSAPACRLVWSEADRLPGLVVDRFGAVLVVQLLTAAMDQRKELLASILGDLLSPAEILFRNDAPARTLEGLPAFVGTHSGRPLGPFWQDIDGLRFEIDLMQGQKTGFFLDQRAQYAAVARLAGGRRVLDCFCNQGAFALFALKAGALAAHAVDIAEEAIASVRRNAHANNLTVTGAVANVFDLLAAGGSNGYDLIVLDPPSFARNRQAIPGALRGYKEINLRALKSLPVGGLLATYSCSQNISREAFESTVREAAADARRSLRVIARTGQPEDHPELLEVPETAYLKGLILEVA